MNELEFIARIIPMLASNDAIVKGAGDDCAVIDVGVNGRWLLFKTDAVVEGIHFLKHADPQKVGRKALARCLSDIAAMAGEPVCALITIGLQQNFDFCYVEKVYLGINQLAQRYGVAVAGGETTTSPERIFISVSLIGFVEKDKCIFRNGARPGDAIFVSGELGGSIEGKHFDFEPRIEQARWLAERFKPTAMIDISDGLATDLRHITTEVGLGAELLESAIPISQDAKRRYRNIIGAKPPLAAALTDGEDFELLFTVPASSAVALLDSWKCNFPELELSCIGRVLDRPEIKIRSKNGVIDFNQYGYIHFA